MHVYTGIWARHDTAQHALLLQYKLVSIRAKSNCARLTRLYDVWRAGLVRFSVTQSFTKNIKHHKELNQDGAVDGCRDIQTNIVVG